MKRIALAGIAGSGKDFLANHLTDTYTLVSFADPLKRVCADLFPFMSVNPPHGLKDEPIGSVDTLSGEIDIQLSHRDIWVKVSSTIRSVNDRIWIDKTLEHINNIKTNVIVTDVRTEDELIALRSFGFTPIWIEPHKPINPELMNVYDLENTMKVRDMCQHVYHNAFHRDPYDFVAFVTEII